MNDLLHNPALVLAAVAVVGLIIFALARAPKQSAAKGRGGDGPYPHAADTGPSNDCGGSGDGGGD